MISIIHAGIIINFIGFFFDIVAIATNHWLKSGSVHAGLFKICRYSECAAVTFQGRYKSMQSLSCLGFLLLLIVSIMAAVYLCKESLRENFRYRRSVGIIMIIGAIFVFIGAMFGLGKTPYSASWSLGLAALGGILSFVAGILVVKQPNTVVVS